MPVHNASQLIREARLKAGLTQEQLSEGICTPQALSRIETGASNVSHVTFQALMERTGVQYGCFPVFNNRSGFECFYGLKRVSLYLDARQLESAYEELNKLEEKNWADNKLYYQEWLMLHCRLQFRSGLCQHQQNFDTLLDALHMTRPDIDLADFHALLLSQTEIQLLTILAQEALHLDMAKLCMQISRQLEDCVASNNFALIVKERMQAENAIVSVKYLIGAGDYGTALETADLYRRKAVRNADDSSLIELTFLTGLCCYYLGKHGLADTYIKASFYSAQAIGSCYATLCRDYLNKETDYSITGSMRELPTAPLKAYPAKSFRRSVRVSDGLFDTEPSGSYTLGKLIQELRLEQKISQQTLCLGLCSKSKLSKIENETLQPDIALTAALLQRLGISGKIFPYWGNEKDARFYNLHFKMMNQSKIPKEKKETYLNEMMQLLDEDDILYHQEYLVTKAFQQASPYERIHDLNKALQLTLPNFNIHQICSYRLTCEELTILTNIAHEYRRTEESHLCSLYFMQILAYVTNTNPDILLQARFLPLTNHMYCHSLYILKFYKETAALPDFLDMSIMKYLADSYGAFCFFYSQALGECSRYAEAHTAAVQAFALNTLMGSQVNASLIKQYIYDDFSIELNY